MSNPIVAPTFEAMNDPDFVQGVQRKYFQYSGIQIPNRKDKKQFDEWLYVHQQACHKAHTGQEVHNRLRAKLRAKLLSKL